MGEDGGIEAEAASLILAAEKLVEPLRKAVDRYKWATWIGAAVLVLLTAALIVLALVAAGQRSQDSQLAAENAALKGSAIALCQAGDALRAGDQNIWHKLFVISYAANKPTPQDRKLGEEFLAYVARVDAQRNCNALVK